MSIEALCKFMEHNYKLNFVDLLLKLNYLRGPTFGPKEILEWPIFISLLSRHVCVCSNLNGFRLS